MKLTRRKALAGLVVASPGATLCLAAPAPVGRVAAIRGSAFALRETARRPLAVLEDLFVGEQVATGAGSALEIRLGSATVIRLGADALLKIDRYLVQAGGVLELGQGAMVFDRDEAAPKADVAIRSPFGLMAVRGTRFFAGPSNGEFGVFVERGLVTVVGASTSVQVGPGQGTDIAAPMGEPSPTHPWGRARIAAAFASVE